ncbi:MAG: 2-oxoacid oxidoreductase gamma-subunit alpha [candidate division WS6 bacterium 34_10]|uniref:2-oxoacid oxidoreductase gamma-subunit alpha n=1 Tax=candidate division WS6 bacterium 34_10 TaxID=1641389 RepID=A0A101HFH4_9BACT|nr:MAG: 2-oxoacid oxidoreductase gamma-subunit alpha [candidate division WS6 bacterium 34_10]
MQTQRVSVKFGGASGQGINTTGVLLVRALKGDGQRVFAYREYPSLIKGGVASYQVDFSNKEINSSSRYCNILLAFTPNSLNEYLKDVKEDGIIVYDQKDINLTDEQKLYIEKKNISSIFLDSENIALEAGGIKIMSNVVMIGFLWRILGLEVETLVDVVLKHFENKNVDLKAEENCIKAGYTSATFRPEYAKKVNTPKKEIFGSNNGYVMTGNHAIGLGAVSAGVRAYYAYPMTPSTSIFKYMGENAKETGILVKQAENEITAVQMAMGSMYMGTRALVATSGGGFDLMSETISCAGISETPLVVILSQRTGAATGLPTWTGASDLNVALKASHGEFPRVVIATSDARTSYTLIQKALNIAEVYQLPVILLMEKQISESIFNFKEMPKVLQIERGLLENTSQETERYQITDIGISPRWTPSKEKKPYLANSDEHSEDSSSIEDSKGTIEMTSKRLRKLETLSKELPEPTLYGDKNPDLVFVGWGSVKNAVLDAIEIDKDSRKIGYLHYEYISPLKTERLEELIAENKRLVLVENNQTGQLGNYIKENIGYEFKEKLLKYDGRPFFVEDILDFLKN